MGMIASVAARELQIAASTLSRWADEGKIKSFRSAGNWRLYPPEEIERVRKLLEDRRA